jgi:uncharacterized membrane protein
MTMSCSARWLGIPWAYALGAVLLPGGPVRADYVFQTIDYSGTTVLYGINDSGQIIGDSPFHRPGSFVESGGVFTTVAVPGHGGLARGINNAGTIVGYYATGGNNFHGFIDQGGTYTTFDAPGAVYGTFATGINDAGDIVGYYRYKQDAAGIRFYSHGFLLSHGVITTFDVPGATSTLAEGINASGQIVGVSYADPRLLDASSFLLSGGAYTTIQLPGEAPDIYALGINSGGQIGGYSFDGGKAHGFVLSGSSEVDVVDPNEDPRLGLDGMYGTYVQGINDSGQVVGYYYDRRYQIHGFLATPVPEPSGLLLLTIGALSVAAHRLTRSQRRRRTR